MSLADQQWCPTSVQVTVLQARGLRVKGKSGTNDAYALMQVGKEKFQTSVVEKTVAPVWKEEATFDLPPVLQGGGGGPERCMLHVHVQHRALVGPDKQLGQAAINLLQLSEDTTRNKTEWFKLLDKTGKADKDRGEVLLDIQFMKNNMTASMFDLSTAGKSRSRLGKFKDKVRGKKKESELPVVPSLTQVLTDSEEEEAAANEDAEGKEGKGKDKKSKKLKMKSLFAPKSNLQRNMSQSMSVLPAKNSSLSGSQSSGLNVESSEGKKKFKFSMHKRSGSSSNKDVLSGNQKQTPAEQSNLCINGSHVYCEEPPPRTSRIGSNFSLASSGHGSMEDVPESSPPSVDSLEAVKEYAPWMEEGEEDEGEDQHVKDGVDESNEEEEERIKMEAERRKEALRRQQEEMERLAEEKLRQEEEERIIVQREEERKREKKREEELEKMRQEEEERVKREEEERIQREKLKLEEEERRKREEEQKILEQKIKLEEEGKRKLQEEIFRREEEKALEKKREEEKALEKKREEEKALEKKREEEKALEKMRQEEYRLAEENRLKEESIKREEERAEERRQQEELLKKQEEEKREEERLKKEEMKRLEEEKARREKEEYERLMEEKRMEDKIRQEEEKERIEEEKRVKEQEERRNKEEEMLRRQRLAEKLRQEEERRVKAEKAKREAEEELRREEEERIKKEQIQRDEEKRRREEEEERARKEKEENERRAEEMRLKEEEKRKEEEERVKERAERERKEEEARNLEKEIKTNQEQRAAEKTSKITEPAEITSNPFDEDFSPEDIPNSPPEPHRLTDKDDTVQRCQSEVSSARSGAVSADEKDLIKTQWEKRPAPQPPGRNPSEMQRQNEKEEDASTQHLSEVNKQSKEKDVKTVSVPPQRSVQMIAPLNRSPEVLKNAPSEPLNNLTKATKHGKRAAPSRPPGGDEPPSKPPRDMSEMKLLRTPQSLNPFDDDDELTDDATARGPPAGSLTANKDDASQAKIKSSKVARAPAPPGPNEAQYDKGDTQPWVKGHVQVQESPNKETEQNKMVAGVKEEGPPVNSRRLLTVKPLNPLEQQQPIALVQEENNKSAGSVFAGDQHNSKVEAVITGPYSQLTQEELISLVLKQEKQLSERDKKISELERYIDNLLVRVIEEQPSILMSLSALK